MYRLGKFRGDTKIDSLEIVQKLNIMVIPFTLLFQSLSKIFKLLANGPDILK